MISDDLVKKLRDFIEEEFIPVGGYSGPMVRHAFLPGSVGVLGNLKKKASSFIEEEKATDTFSVLLNKKREERILTERDLYKKAWIDKRLSSKIMNSRHYHPSKDTVFAFGLALELDSDEFGELLESAGYAFNHSSIPDLLVLFCVRSKIYDLHDVNALLVVLEQKPLCRQPRN